jgi:hypothetical protein
MIRLVFSTNLWTLVFLSCHDHLFIFHEDLFNRVEFISVEDCSSFPIAKLLVVDCFCPFEQFSLWLSFLSSLQLQYKVLAHLGMSLAYVTTKSLSLLKALSTKLA